MIRTRAYSPKQLYNKYIQARNELIQDQKLHRDPNQRIRTPLNIPSFNKFKKDPQRYIKNIESGKQKMESYKS